MRRVVLALSFVMASVVSITGFAQETGKVTEFPLAWPGKGDSGGSTHEIAYRKGHPPGDKSTTHFWITGPNYGSIARVSLEGKATFFPMDSDPHAKKHESDGHSGPHGIVFDAAGQLWVSLEHEGFVARVSDEGQIVERIDVRMHVKGTKKPINTSPHGLGLDADGKTIWFTGKKTGTVGKINSDRTVEHFELPTVGTLPIYLSAGPDGNMWCTELVGNKVARITPQGEVKEYDVSTPNSRPIAVTPGPDGKSMWFSEEAGNNVARIELATGTVTEFAVPSKQEGVILAALVFDRDGNLWTQSYADQNRKPRSNGPDHIIKIDKSISNVAATDKIPMTYYPVPSRGTVMHRIIEGPDGNIWFTELRTDKLGKLTAGMGPQ